MSRNEKSSNKYMFSIIAGIVFIIMVLIAYFLCKKIIKRFLIILICELILGLCAYLIYSILNVKNHVSSGKSEVTGYSNRRKNTELEEDDIDDDSFDDDTDEEDYSDNDEMSYGGHRLSSRNTGRINTQQQADFRISDSAPEFVFKRAEYESEQIENVPEEESTYVEPNSLGENVIVPATEDAISQEDIMTQETSQSASFEISDNIKEEPITNLFMGMGSNEDKIQEPLQKEELFTGELFRGQVKKNEIKENDDNGSPFFQGQGYRSPFISNDNDKK